MVFDFFKSSKQTNADRKANRNYRFLVLNNQAVTVYDLTDNDQEIQLHTPHPSNLENWFRQPRVFCGQILQYISNYKAEYIRPGDDVVLYNPLEGTYSQILRVDAIFHTPNISEKVSPLAFVQHIGDENVLSEIFNITSPDEYVGFTALIHNLFMRAMIANSWTVSTRTIFQHSGYFLPELLEPWVDALVQAGAITASQKEYTIQNNLIYMMMHAINLTKRKPVFVF